MGHLYVSKMQTSSGLLTLVHPLDFTEKPEKHLCETLGALEALARI